MDNYYNSTRSTFRQSSFIGRYRKHSILINRFNKQHNDKF